MSRIERVGLLNSIAVRAATDNATGKHLMRILLRSIASTILVVLTALVCVVIVPTASCVGAQYALAHLHHGGSPDVNLIVFGIIILVFGGGKVTLADIEALSRRSPGSNRVGLDVSWRLIAAHTLLHVLAGALAVGIAALGWALDFYTESEFLRKQGPIMLFGFAYLVVISIGIAVIHKYILEWRHEQGDI